MHIKADVDIGDEITACGGFQVTSVPYSIDAPKEEVASAEGKWFILPPFTICLNQGLLLQSTNDAERDFYFGTSFLHVRFRRPYHAVKVMILNAIRVIEHVLLESNMR